MRAATVSHELGAYIGRQPGPVGQIADALLPTRPSLNPTSFLAHPAPAPSFRMAFYGDAQYDSPYYAPSPQAERPALGSSIGYDTFTAISASQHPSVHPSHSTFEATTAYAPYATGADS